MKKIFLFCIGILLIITTSCVVGDDGATFLAYSWSGLPTYWYDENPSLPDTIYNGTYYTTNEGSYYMEYTAWDNSSWWMYYTISANPGELFTNGAPAYFEIYLSSYGPSFYKWNYAREIEPRSDMENVEKDKTSFMDKSIAGSFRKTMQNYGVETKTVENITIILEFGMLESLPN